MKINIRELQANYKKLCDIVDNYLYVFNNYYNELNFLPNYWKSPKADYYNFVIIDEITI